MHLTYAGTSPSAQIRSYLLRSGSDLAVAGEHLPPSRTRSVGRPREAGREGRRNPGTLRGRCRHWIPRPARSEAVRRSLKATAEQVWIGTERREDAVDPVWAFCAAEPGGTWGGKARVVHLSGIPACLCGEQSGAI